VPDLAIHSYAEKRMEESLANVIEQPVP
jgi:hypothetical protein